MIKSVQFFAISFGMCTILLVCGDCRPASVVGTVTKTKVQNFPFFARIANPCEIGPGSRNNEPMTTASSVVTEGTSRLDFYQSVATSLELVLRKLEILEAADPSLPECNGITLDSLPATPQLDNMNTAEVIKQAYKTGIFLATHFHLVTIDRQLTQTNGDNQPDEQSEDEVPTWRFRRCGNESESLGSSLEDATIQVENFVCTILTSATDQQRASFREPFNQLQRTMLYRYHTSCSMLQTRDCLVVREAKQATSAILRKFSSLITYEAEHGNGNKPGEESDDDMLDNNL